MHIKTALPAKAALWAALACGLSWGQPADDSTPATTNVMGAEYPRVHLDRRVTFRIQAPDAQKVQVDLGKLWDTQRDSEGVWTVTVPPQAPGFHYYYLNIDGVRVNDPASETFYGAGRESSGIEIPEMGVDYYDIKDVPHGEIRQVCYYSTVTESWRRVRHADWIGQPGHQPSRVIQRDSDARPRR